MLRRCCAAMPQQLEAHLKGALITCVGFLASSLGVFVSILSVVVSPLFSLFSTPKPIFIGEGKIGPTPRLQHPSQKIRPRHIHQPLSDKSSSHSSNTLSSNDTTHSTWTNSTTGNESRRTPSPNGTRSAYDTQNTSEPPVPSRSSTPRLMSVSSSPSPPRSPRNNLKNYLGMRKRSILRNEATTGDEFNLEKASHGLDRAEIIVSPPTPSSSVFPRSAPGPSEVRLDEVSRPGKTAARFVKSHSKRHSLSAACPRKRRSGKRSSGPPTPISVSPTMTPVVESKWRIGTRASQRKKRKSLRIDPPQWSATSPVFIETGDDVGGTVIYEEPASITRPPIHRSPLPPTRQGPVRTRPYEAPYFFPTPGSLEAVGYVDRVREERRSALVHPDAMCVRSKKDLRSSTMSSLEKGGSPGLPKPRGEGGHDQATEDGNKKRPKSCGKGSGDRNTNPFSSISVDELGVQVGTPTRLRKTSAPPKLSPSLGPGPTLATPSRPQVQRQGSLGIMRILGKH